MRESQDRKGYYRPKEDFKAHPKHMNHVQQTLSMEERGNLRKKRPSREKFSLSNSRPTTPPTSLRSPKTTTALGTRPQTPDPSPHSWDTKLCAQPRHLTQASEHRRRESQVRFWCLGRRGTSTCVVEGRHARLAVVGAGVRGPAAG